MMNRLIFVSKVGFNAYILDIAYNWYILNYIFNDRPIV